MRRGTILHRMFTTTQPPKNKFFVVIGENDTNLMGFFFVNSKINQYAQRNPAVFKMQMPIQHANYDFLNYDSFVSAHELKTIDKASLCAELEKRTTSMKGHLTDSDLEQLLAVVRNSWLNGQNGA